MNERIKELALQAKLGPALLLHYYRTIHALTDTEQEGLEQIEKFAELIVAECMRQVEEQYKPVLEDETMMKDTHWDGYVQCGVDSYVAIREHFFGVEE
jgi:hypothetical protein